MNLVTFDPQLPTKQSRLVDILVFSEDHLQRDLLEAGISKSPAVGRSAQIDISAEDVFSGSSQTFDPNVVLIGIGTSRAIQRAFEVGAAIRAQFEDCAVVVLAGSTQVCLDIQSKLPDAGPRWSFLTTDLIKGVDDLIRIVESAAVGMTIIDPGFLQHASAEYDAVSYLNRDLTPRQLEVLDLVSQGFRNSEISGRLDISLRTVEYHLNESYISIKNCHSPEYNRRTYAARIYVEHLKQAHQASSRNEIVKAA